MDGRNRLLRDDGNCRASMATAARTPVGRRNTLKRPTQMNYRLSLMLPCIVSAQVLLASGPKPAAEPAVPVPQPRDSSVEEAPLPPIREFDVATLSRLGREIYRQDQYAWHGTDAVMEKVGQAQMVAEKCCGWVVDTSGAEPLLRFVRKTSDGEEAAYDVRFPTDAKPAVSVPENRALTEHQKALRRAFATASKGFGEAGLPICRCRGSYNFVVLDDPSGAGFLVYLLRPKTTDDEIPVGGHYRISVSADGGMVTQIDRLWRSCLTMDRRQGIPADGKIAGIGMTHIVSATPLETHVFLSLQEKLPFSVVTNDGRMWKVESGEIQRINAGEDSTPGAKVAK